MTPQEQAAAASMEAFVEAYGVRMSRAWGRACLRRLVAQQDWPWPFRHYSAESYWGRDHEYEFTRDGQVVCIVYQLHGALAPLLPGLNTMAEEFNDFIRYAEGVSAWHATSGLCRHVEIWRLDTVKGVTDHA